MRLGITGGCGFVGVHLARRLVNSHKVTIFDNLSRRGSEISLQELVKYGCEFIHGDIRNQNDVKQLRGCDVILDCAAQPSAVDGFDNPRFDFETNTVGVFNVLELARETKCGIIYWSTNKIYSADKINSIPYQESFDRKRWEWSSKYKVTGIPEDFPIDGGNKSIYGVSKVSADLWCQEYGEAFNLPIIINRCGCLYGDRQWGKATQGWFIWMCLAAYFKKPIDIIGWEGKQVRDLLFIDDLCDLVEKQISCIGDFYGGEVFNVGGGFKNAISILDAIDIISERSPCNIRFDDERRKSDHRIYITDNKKISDKFNWKPTTSVKDGYGRIFDWIRKEEDTLKQLYG